MTDASSIRLAAGDLAATILPDRGMLIASLRHCGVELLRRIDNLDEAAKAGSTAGIPLLYPWANRLSGMSYRFAGREVSLDRASPLLHFDSNGLPIHGVPWSKLAWSVTAQRSDRVAAMFDWTGRDLEAIFPFPHRLEMEMALAPNDLTVTVKVIAANAGPVPVSFGFHPYLGIADVARANWRLRLPAMRRLAFDGRRIPTGAESPFGPFDEELGDRDLDDGFALAGECATLSVVGGGRRISIMLGSGYTHAQVYAPRGKDLIALEPMTAPTNALVGGRGLRSVALGESFSASFSVVVEAR
jgi:aldose 1-epimerase